MELTRPFVFLKRCWLAACEERGLAVLWKEALSHLRARRRGSGIDVSRRHKIAEAVSSWPIVIPRQGWATVIQLPTANH